MQSIISYIIIIIFYYIIYHIHHIYFVMPCHIDIIDILSYILFEFPLLACFEIWHPPCWFSVRELGISQGMAIFVPLVICMKTIRWICSTRWLYCMSVCSIGKLNLALDLEKKIRAPVSSLFSKFGWETFFTQTNYYCGESGAKTLQNIKKDCYLNKREAGELLSQDKVHFQAHLL